jgi:hypothetical protein
MYLVDGMSLHHIVIFALCDRVHTYVLVEKKLLTLKILSDQIWISSYFGQPLTYPNLTIFSSDFLCNSLKS